jgi:integrase
MSQKKLTALKVESLTEPKWYSDGEGLYLYIAKGGSKSWAFRYQFNKKRRLMGLGGYHSKTNTLAMARVKATAAKALVDRGIDPLVQQRENKAELVESENLAKREDNLKNMTFKVCAENYIETMKVQWSNEKHIQQWTNTLTTYAYPHIGDMPVKDIETEHVRLVLDPIWNTKTETANRVRQRIESVISYAIANKYRETLNPAIWKGLLDTFYPKPEKVKQIRYEQAGKVKHHNALPYDDMPAFMIELRKMDGTAAQALRFIILTASRTGEVLFATWDEFNLEKKEWNIPAARMKARKAHRVALSDAVIQLLESLPRVSEYVFSGLKIDKPMSNGAMSSVLKRMDRKGITVHGFRSTFRDYIGEETGFPYRLAEFALAHGLTDEAEKAYARGDMLKKRFKMMNAWADYVDSLFNTSNVVSIKKKSTNQLSLL